MWDKEGAGAHLSAGVPRGAGGLCTDVQEAAAFTLSNVSQPSPFTTKLQVTSGHLGPKINSSPCFKIEIKLDLRTKMYVYNASKQDDARGSSAVMYVQLLENAHHQSQLTTFQDSTLLAFKSLTIGMIK